MTISRKRSPSPLDNGHSTDNGDGEHDSDWTSNYRNISGLHQRHPTTSSSQQQTEQRRKTLTDQYKERSRNKRRHGARQYHHSRGARLPPLGRWLRSCLIAGIPAYIVAMIFLYKFVSEQHDTFRTFAQLTKDSHLNRRAREAKDHQEALFREHVRRTLQKRAQQRRMQTSPPETAADEDYIYSYTIRLADQEKRPIYPEEYPESLEGGESVPMEQLCGYLAQTASVGNHQSYVERDLLNEKARVLITGILNPVGFHLALALKERCGVNVITGLDPMFPNTVEHRLQVAESLKILTCNIPKLMRPVVTTHVGGDPHKLPRKTLPTLDSTGEMDYWGFRPTHIVHLASVLPEGYRSNSTPPDWKNLGSPYVSPDYDPALYAIRSSLTSMEQILASIAQVDPSERPHFIYASSNLIHNPAVSTLDRWHGKMRLMDEILADHYYNFHGVYSVAMRFPNTIYGPWGHSDSVVHRLLEETIGTAAVNNSLADNDAFYEEDRLDLVHVDEAVDTVIAAMQFRHTSYQPLAFDITSGGTLSPKEIKEVARAIHSRETNQTTSVRRLSEFAVEHPTRQQTRTHLAWHHPSIPLVEGLTQTMAWHLDRSQPFGSRGNDDKFELGDNLMQRHALPTCAADDLLCNRGRASLPCTSDCAIRSQCIPSMFDSIVPLIKEVTESCDIVLYTQELGRDVQDLRLHSDYMADGDPLICNFAMVSVESPLVESVINKVPDSELEKLGVVPSPNDQGNPDAFRKRKLTKLNGRLLFRGWILIWPEETPEVVSELETSLIKITPGALFSNDVKYAVFVDQSFTVSPSIADIQFLVNEMHRETWPSRLVKRKTRPKAKFLLPPEPERRAVILLSELRYQESIDKDRLPSDTKISVYEATRFMRFEIGEEPLGPEPREVKAQREFYERLNSVVNRDLLRSSAEPVHKFELTQWARTRWVIHDLRLEEARLFRCDWFQEHIDWGTELDQLSLAFSLAKRDVLRRVAHEEIDENVQKSISEKTEMKKLLSDTFEWHALQTEQNKQYSPYEDMLMLPYEIDFVPDEVVSQSDPSAPVPLFARIISDRIMAYSRKSWNEEKELEAMKKELAEKAAQESENQHEKEGEAPREGMDGEEMQTKEASEGDIIADSTRSDELQERPGDEEQSEVRPPEENEGVPNDEIANDAESEASEPEVEALHEVIENDVDTKEDGHRLPENDVGNAGDSTDEVLRHSEEEADT